MGDLVMSKPLIYQILPRLWANKQSGLQTNGSLSDNGCGKFSDIDTEFFSYLKELGVSHIWYTGIIRHAILNIGAEDRDPNIEWIKGRAGSPYAISDYYDVNPYLADNEDRRMEEFEALVDRTHKAGMKVIIDFVPNHVARNYGEFAVGNIVAGKDSLGHWILGAEDDKNQHWREENDFFYYPNESFVIPREALSRLGHDEQIYLEYPAKASGNNYTSRPSINDWYDTIKINYCDTHSPTWDKMLDILKFWAKKGVDAFRCDMVELVPKAFFQWAIQEIKKDFPHVIFIAEVYSKPSYNEYVNVVGFDYLYDKSGLYDSLKSIVLRNISNPSSEVEQWQSTKLITWNWQQLSGIQANMLNFLENHDEQRFASDFFAKDASRVFPSLVISLLFNTAAFMLYFGQEVGEKGMEAEGLSGVDGRTSIFDWWSPSSINALYRYIHGDKLALTSEQMQILSGYKQLLQYACLPAFSNGKVYDLCYCNFDSWGFDSNRHFAFIRASEDEVYLVVVNFSEKNANISLTIPQDCIDFVGYELNRNIDILVSANYYSIQKLI